MDNEENNINSEEYYENLTLEEAIAEFNKWSKRAIEAPWYIGDDYEDEWDNKITPIGPYDMSESPVKNPYESTLAEFWSGNYDGRANAFAAAYAMLLVPMLIDRVRELERGSSVELSAEVTSAIETLFKWRKGG